MSVGKPCILFTAFEPSGDEHAAAVIRPLRQMLPWVAIHALGGPRMEQAGATLIERTTEQSAMLTGALHKARQQLALRKRFKTWLRQHAVAVHVPTDSPAANWWFCKTIKGIRGQGSGVRPRVVHFVAPQVWAWAPWRVRRLRKWSDLVLCVLPFEPRWFERHAVHARFVGHPLFDDKLDLIQLAHEAAEFPEGHPQVALLPGSRPGEIAANWPLMVEVFRRLRARYPAIRGLIAAAGEEARGHIQRITPELPAGLNLATGMTDAVLHGPDVVLAVSGTVTLHVARHPRPMAILYRVPAWQWNLAGRWLMDTQTFTLPNLLACDGPSNQTDRHIVREFVPFLGRVEAVDPIVQEMVRLIDDKDHRESQIKSLKHVLQPFAGHACGKEAAQVIAAQYRCVLP